MWGSSVRVRVSHLYACARTKCVPGPLVSPESGVESLKTYFVATGTEARANPTVPERQQPGCQTLFLSQGIPKNELLSPRIVEILTATHAIP